MDRRLLLPGLAVLLAVVLSGCYMAGDSLPEPWVLEPTNVTLERGEWASHQYEAGPHVLVINFTVHTGPGVSVIAFPLTEYDKFVLGEEYDFEGACTHAPAPRMIISCGILETGKFAYVILNGPGPYGDEEAEEYGPANVTYFSSGSRISSEGRAGI